MAILIWVYALSMKTTVELPDELLRNTRQYAADRGKSFKDVLVQALGMLIYNGEPQISRPGWEALFGTFRDDKEMVKVREIIDTEFSRIDPEDWK